MICKLVSSGYIGNIHIRGRFIEGRYRVYRL